MNKEEAKNILTIHFERIWDLTFDEIKSKKGDEIIYEKGKSGQQYAIEINIGPVNEVNTDDYQVDFYAFEKDGRRLLTPNVYIGFVINKEKKEKLKR
jgi:hypothetical protein